MSLTDVLREIEQCCLQAADQTLREDGFCPPPQLHMLAEDVDPPYVGYVTTRPYARGADAVDAIVGLGAAPAALMATHALIIWEESDLRASLSGPGDHPNGVAAVRASLTEHNLNWYPFDAHVAASSCLGVPTVQPQWGTPSTHVGAALPPVIEALLAQWRGLDGEPANVLATMQTAGYEVRLVQ